MKKLVTVLFLMTSFASMADIHCIIENQNEIIIGETTFTVVTPEREVVYPRMVANKTYPEIGVVSAFKGRYSRSHGSSTDYSVLSMRVDGVENDVAFGSISMSGRDRSLGLSGLKVKCEKSVLHLFE
jgi:hypothetical protein